MISDSNPRRSSVGIGTAGDCFLSGSVDFVCVLCSEGVGQTIDQNSLYLSGLSFVGFALPWTLRSASYFGQHDHGRKCTLFQFITLALINQKIMLVSHRVQGLKYGLLGPNQNKSL